MGNDVINGGAAGSDTASYADAAAAVTVILAHYGSAQNTIGAGCDTLANFENLTHSARNDILTGDAKVNVVSGLAGNDMLNGGLGDDAMDAGPPPATRPAMPDATATVTVSLAHQGSPQNTVRAGSDTLRNFDRIGPRRQPDRRRQPQYPQWPRQQ